MKISTTNISTYKPTFSALKEVEYTGYFLPNTDVEDARSVRNFLENESFQKLCQIYDVKAEFHHGKYCGESNDFLTLYCTGVKPSQNKQQDKAKEKISFIKKLKSFFSNKHQSEPIEIKEGDNFKITFISNGVRFKDDLANVTWNDIQKKMSKAKKIQDENANNQQELDNIKKAHSQWL